MPSATPLWALRKRGMTRFRGGIDGRQTVSVYSFSHFAIFTSCSFRCSLSSAHKSQYVMLSSPCTCPSNGRRADTNGRRADTSAASKRANCWQPRRLSSRTMESLNVACLLALLRRIPYLYITPLVPPYNITDSKPGSQGERRESKDVQRTVTL